MRLVTVLGVVAGLSLGASASASADPPVTTITSGPDGTSVLTTPRIYFIADKPATFECSVDEGDFSACSSPATIGPLALGPHSFAVRAIGSNGETETSPPMRRWTVEPGLTAPTIELMQPNRRTLRISTLRSFSGTAVAPSGIKRVQVALAIGDSDKDYFPPRCNFFDLRNGKPAPQACLLPRYFPATGTTNWRYAVSARLRKRLKPGRYILTIRAFNGYQQATQQRFTLTLRP